jgi:hypothetical protein
MARKQSLVFLHLCETWLGNYVSWFGKCGWETMFGLENMSRKQCHLFAQLSLYIKWLENNVFWFAQLLGNVYMATGS